MTRAFAQRQLILAGVALLAAIVALVVTERRSSGEAEEGAPERGSVAVVGEGWYQAVAAPYRPTAGDRTGCGIVLKADTPGVAHPVLPCGAKIVLSHDGREVLTEVIDRGPGVPGRDFDVTLAVAQRLGLTGQQPISWRFAK